LGLFSFLGGTGVWIQGFRFARQALYYLSLFTSLYLSDRVLSFCLGLVLDHNPTSTSWAPRINACVPPHPARIQRGFCVLTSLKFELRTSCLSHPLAFFVMVFFKIWSPELFA
jgi:hypothetical protein